MNDKPSGLTTQEALAKIKALERYTSVMHFQTNRARRDILASLDSFTLAEVCEELNKTLPVAK
jgi:hypothetical protein